jgi:hypothetical protein
MGGVPYKIDAATIADFDGDGTSDVVLDASYYPANVPISLLFLAGLPGGGFVAPIITSLGVTQRSNQAAAVDAHSDLGAEYVRRFHDHWMIYDVLAGGSFVSLSSIPAVPVINVAGSGGYQILLIPTDSRGFGADFDGDADRDLLVLAPDREWQVWHADGSGPLIANPRRLPADLRTGGAAFAGDADGDGDTDVVVRSEMGAGATLVNPLRVAFNDGFGTLASGPVPAAPVSQSLFSVASGDFDGDGDLDLFTGPEIYRNDGGTTGFTRIAYPPAVNGAFIQNRFPVVGDFNGDGKPDLAFNCNNGGTGAVFVAFNAGWPGLAFAIPTNLGGGANCLDLAADDLESDGDLDLVCVGTAGPTGNGVFVNAGSGVFLSIPLSFNGHWVTTGDFDGDGYADLDVEGQIYYVTPGALATGPVVPPPPALVGTGGPSYPLPEIAADFDEDGLADLLGSGFWRRNLGAATFAAPEIFAPERLVLSPNWNVQLPLRRAHVGDLDGDGDLDFMDGDRRPYLNRRRHLALAKPARIGHVGTLAIAGPPSAPFDLVVSASRSAAPLPLGAWGAFYLDLPSAFVILHGALNAAGEASLSLFVPNNPALVGLSVAWQAAFPAEARLGGLLETPIVAY